LKVVLEKNTLTDIGKFWDKSFNIVVANPPYGVDWKGFEKDIKNDTTERFVALPSISDGQFLFTQHILHKLADDGLSIVVHNGSTLFSVREIKRRGNKLIFTFKKYTTFSRKGQLLEKKEVKSL
jgi:type I restriction-modification system DNA methylase subunit